MLGHGALGEHPLGGSAQVLSLVEQKALRKGGLPDQVPTRAHIEAIRALAEAAEKARKLKRERDLEEARLLREAIEHAYMVSIGAYHEPWVWPELPHPEVDISDLAYRIGGEPLRDKFDRLIWETQRTQLQIQIEADEEDIALLLAAA